MVTKIQTTKCEPNMSVSLFSFHFQFEEVDAELLQELLNERILKGLDCKTLRAWANKILK